MRHERCRCSSETLQLVWQRLEQAEKLGDAYDLAVAHFQYGFALLWHGDALAARDWMERANESLGRMGARLWQLRCLAYLSVVSRRLHEPERLRSEIPPLLALARTINEYMYLGIGQANQGWLAWQDGDAVRAEQLCKEATTAWTQIPECPFHALADWVLLAVALAEGDFSRLEAAARMLMDPNPALQPVDEPMSSQLRQALAACEAGERTTAFELFRRALEAARGAGEL
jgi:hypothetical protein